MENHQSQHLVLSFSVFTFLYNFSIFSAILEHVWEVFVQRKGLGEHYGILGNYRLCITDKTLTLVRIGPPTVSGSGERRVEHVEFSLSFIRR